MTVVTDRPNPPPALEHRDGSSPPDARPYDDGGRPRGPRPRIVLNALSLQPQGCGVQCYVRELVSAMGELGALETELRADLVAVVDPGRRADIAPTVRTQSRPAARTATRVASGAVPFGRTQLVHGLDVQVPLRSSPSTATVVTVHDLSVFDVPWSYRRRYASLQRAVMAHAMRRADAVIADSAFTAERIRDRFRRHAAVVALAAPGGMAPPAPDAVARLRHRLELPDRFVLYVGRVEPRKDVGALAAACAWAGVPLVVAGRSASVPAGAMATGYVPASDLSALYGAATVVGYPSLYEGYGLPPLEAMACGTPVVAYRIPPLAETLDGAAELVPVRDVDAMGRAVRALFHDADRHAELRLAGLARARGRSWFDTARRTAEVYRRLGVAC